MDGEVSIIKYQNIKIGLIDVKEFLTIDKSLNWKLAKIIRSK